MKPHSKYGFNPTMPLCFWCNEPKGTIAMLGDTIKGEAPRHMYADYEPCSACQEKWKTKVCIIEVTPKPNTEDQLPIQENAYPTGNYMLANEGALKNMKPGSTGLMSQELFQDIANKKGGEKEND